MFENLERLQRVIWHLTSDIWHSTIDRYWNFTFVIWHLTSDIWHLTYDIWHLTSDIGHWTSDIWHLSSDICHLSSDIWHLSFAILYRWSLPYLRKVLDPDAWSWYLILVIDPVIGTTADGTCTDTDNTGMGTYVIGADNEAASALALILMIISYFHKYIFWR